MVAQQGRNSGLVNWLLTQAYLDAFVPNPERVITALARAMSKLSFLDRYGYEMPRETD